MASSSKLFQPLLELPLRLVPSAAVLDGAAVPHSPWDIFESEEDEEQEEEDDPLLPHGLGMPAGGPIAVWFPFPDWPTEPGI